MWTTIDRARRRLTGGASPTDDTADVTETDAASSDDVSPSGEPTSDTEDVLIILGGVEVDRLTLALQRMLGSAVERPDTPARIEGALTLVLDRRGSPGKASVLRRPAGLSSPESWEIHLAGVDQTIGSAVRDAGRTGRFAA